MGEHRRAFCLLLHGFNGEPLDMQELEQELHAAGFAARTLLLPGHCATARDFAAHGWDEWLTEVHGETRQALASYERVFVIGHSLGAALTLAVAAREPEVAGIVALCPPTRLNPHLGALSLRLQHVVPYIPSWGDDLRDRWGARKRYPRSAYRWTALKTVNSLYAALPDLRAALPTVRCPALIIAARHDHVVPSRDAEEAYRLLGSQSKELVMLERSFHAVTKDLERQVVFERVIAFCERETVASRPIVL